MRDLREAGQRQAQALCHAARSDHVPVTDIVEKCGKHECQQLTKCFPDEAAALRYARALLARRRTAQRRLGVGYVGRAG